MTSIKNIRHLPVLANTILHNSQVYNRWPCSKASPHGVQRDVTNYIQQVALLIASNEQRYAATIAAEKDWNNSKKYETP